MTTAVDPLALLADLLDPPHTGMDPVTWVQERLGEHLWSRQADILRSVWDHRFTAVRSCHGIGKSFVASRAVLAWLDTHPIEESFVVTSAPSAAQVSAILWREIERGHRKGALRGRITTGGVPAWKVGKEMFGFGRKPADLVSPEQAATAFQGIHARYVLVVLDEACGIPKWLWDATMALVTNDDGRVLAIGNPDDPTSYFREVCRDGSLWNRIQVGYRDTPNFTGEPVPDHLRHLLISRRWVEERGEEWGVGSPLYVAKVEGEFPDRAQDGVAPLGWLQACHRNPPRRQPGGPKWLGVDVGAGGDESVVALRDGTAARILHSDRDPDTMRTAERVARLAGDHGVTRIKVDSIGIGKGVADRLRQLRTDGWHDAEVVPVNVGRAPRDPRRFVRLRDQLWWEIARDLSETRAWDLSGVDEAVLNQLAAPKYQHDSSRRIKVERKEETKARIGRSPDQADALLLAWYAGSVARSEDVQW